MTKEEWTRKNYEKYKPIYDEWIKLYPFTTENLDGEIWLPIPKYEELYHFSNFGRVKRFYKNGKVIIRKPSLDRRGYLYVNLCKNNKTRTFRVHMLVGKLFITNPDNKPEINHRYSRFSNHINCLEWATPSENQKHAVRTGLQKTGEESGRAKLTNEQVQYIRENPDGLNTSQLAEKLNVTATTISRIQRGKKYKQAGGTIRDKKFTRSIVTDEMRAQILARYKPGVRGCGCKALAKEFGVCPQTICNIVNGK